MKLRIKDNNKSNIKLQIKESGDINESLEQIANETYCTDYVGDVVNWLLNKPMPYRIVYDSKYDIYCIADATKNTHKDMSIDIFDSDYLYGISRHLDDDINEMRDIAHYNDGYTDAEVYSDFGFDSGFLKGLFFIPVDDEYFNYEASGFYTIATPITSGTIYSKYQLERNFKDLYNKLAMRKAFVDRDSRLPLDSIWFWASDYKDKEYMFTDKALSAGYSKNEIDNFLKEVG
jgi:hypothetical protein